MALLSEGQIIRETYEVERFLGEGAFAEVYRVKHRFLGRQAMKVFKRGGMTLTEIEEMLGEAIMLSRIGKCLWWFKSRGACGCSKKGQGVDLFGQAKIADPRPQSFHLVTHENILRFDVAMNYGRALPVSYGKASADLFHQINRGFNRNKLGSMRMPEFF